MKQLKTRRMPHMKSKGWTLIAAGLLLTLNHVNAQIRQPLPTGQVPKAYTGVQAGAAPTFKPKPTGQIAPEVPGQPVGTLPQPATTTQKVPEVQNLGFESYTAPATQAGMVPKVNTSQDPRVMPERYQPDAGQPQPVVTTEQFIQQVQTQQLPSTGAYAPADQTVPAQTNAQSTPGTVVNTSQPTQPGQGNMPAPTPQLPQSNTPKAAPQRVDPN
ncbi:hypothetical protein LZD49_06580 [Dyadobacter sp. CY261]|uniref:hypothetical protein n=1 Tax=Dyadobacter sp. CY261 TaxID=2907203 RepID=UPI001F4158C5|nr:hypothetical protein [Dyadobacter sp. CY261]MCF0070130.1 hypothetical protein [Dyadobacter sp. CY261]